MKNSWLCQALFQQKSFHLEWNLGFNRHIHSNDELDSINLRAFYIHYKNEINIVDVSSVMGNT